MTSQSPPANVVICAKAIPAVNNATFNQGRTVPIISALFYRKANRSQCAAPKSRLSPRPRGEDQGEGSEPEVVIFGRINPHPPSPLPRARRPAALRLIAERSKLPIDLLIFRFKNRKCFCLLDVSAALGLL